MSSGRNIEAAITVLENEDYWTVEVIEQPEGDWIITNFHGIRAEERAREYAEFLREQYAKNA